MPGRTVQGNGDGGEPKAAPKKAAAAALGASTAAASKKHDIFPIFAEIANAIAAKKTAILEVISEVVIAKLEPQDIAMSIKLLIGQKIRPELNNTIERIVKSSDLFKSLSDDDEAKEAVAAFVDFVLFDYETQPKGFFPQLADGVVANSENVGATLNPLLKKLTDGSFVNELMHGKEHLKAYIQMAEAVSQPQTLRQQMIEKLGAELTALIAGRRESKTKAKYPFAILNEADIDVLVQLIKQKKTDFNPSAATDNDAKRILRNTVVIGHLEQQSLVNAYILKQYEMLGVLRDEQGGNILSKMQRRRRTSFGRALDEAVKAAGATIRGTYRDSMRGGMLSGDDSAAAEGTTQSAKDVFDPVTSGMTFGRGFTVNLLEGQEPRIPDFGEEGNKGDTDMTKEGQTGTPAGATSTEADILAALEVGAPVAMQGSPDGAGAGALPAAQAPAAGAAPSNADKSVEEIFWSKHLQKVKKTGDADQSDEAIKAIIKAVLKDNAEDTLTPLSYYKIAKSDADLEKFAALLLPVYKAQQEQGSKDHDIVKAMAGVKFAETEIDGADAAFAAAAVSADDAQLTEEQQFWLLMIRTTFTEVGAYGTQSKGDDDIKAVFREVYELDDYLHKNDFTGDANAIEQQKEALAETHLQAAKQIIEAPDFAGLGNEQKQNRLAREFAAITPRKASLDRAVAGADAPEPEQEQEPASAVELLRQAAARLLGDDANIPRIMTVTAAISEHLDMENEEAAAALTTTQKEALVGAAIEVLNADDESTKAEKITALKAVGCKAGLTEVEVARATPGTPAAAGAVDDAVRAAMLRRRSSVEPENANDAAASAAAEGAGSPATTAAVTVATTSGSAAPLTPDAAAPAAAYLPPPPPPPPPATSAAAPAAAAVAAASHSPAVAAAAVGVAAGGDAQSLEDKIRAFGQRLDAERDAAAVPDGKREAGEGKLSVEQQNAEVQQIQDVAAAQGKTFKVAGISPVKEGALTVTWERNALDADGQSIKYQMYYDVTGFKTSDQKVTVRYNQPLEDAIAKGDIKVACLMKAEPAEDKKHDAGVMIRGQNPEAEKYGDKERLTEKAGFAERLRQQRAAGLSAGTSR